MHGLVYGLHNDAASRVSQLPLLGSINSNEQLTSKSVGLCCKRCSGIVILRALHNVSASSFPPPVHSAKLLTLVHLRYEYFFMPNMRNSLQGVRQPVAGLTPRGATRLLPGPLHSGVKQGDPLAPLLFAPTLQGPPQRAATARPAAQIVDNFDDIDVVGPSAAAAAHAFEALSIKVRTAGLIPVASKSAAYGSDQDMAAAAAAELGVLHARYGLISGTPIGTDPFVRDFLSRKRQEVCDKIRCPVDLHHPLTFQNKWLILSCFLQLRLQHLPNSSMGCGQPIAPTSRCRCLQSCPHALRST
jgi:hypothetical protein